MKYALVTVIMISATLTGFVVWGQNSKEPSQTAYLTIDGNEHELVVGEETRILINEKDHAVKITLDPYRLFQAAGLKFKYPSKMCFTVDDSSPNLTIWSLDGDSSVIMVHLYEVDIEEKIILQSIKNQYLQMNATIDVKDVELKGKNTVLKGKGLEVELGNIFLYQELYMIKNRKTTVALIFQDTLDDRGKNTGEYTNLIKSVSASLEIK